MGATILPAPAPALASQLTMSVDPNGNGCLRIANGAVMATHSPTFIRVTGDDGDDGSRVFVAHAATDRTGTILRLPRVGNDVTLRVERLIVGGT